MPGISPTVVGLAVFVGIPLILWAEAFMRAEQWFSRVATCFVVGWFCAVGIITLQESLCEGSSIKGFELCTVPILANGLLTLLAFAVLSLVLLVYFIALAIRIVNAIR